MTIMTGTKFNLDNTIFILQKPEEPLSKPEKLPPPKRLSSNCFPNLHLPNL